MKRAALIAVVIAAFVTFALAGAPAKKAPAAAASAQATLPAAAVKSDVKIDFDAANAAPRELEDTTQKAIVRDYGAAWTVLARALHEGRTDELPLAFTGVAQERVAARVKDQKASGLRTRTVDRGHKLEAVFYSPEGSAMQLRDTANLEIELLDGNTVVGRQQVTAHYVALMTVAEDRWKVRVLQEVPGF